MAGVPRPWARLVSLLLAVLGIIAGASGPVDAGYWTRGDRPTLDRGGVVWIVTPEATHNVHVDRHGAVRRITKEPTR